jgi:hypothetical protein
MAKKGLASLFTAADIQPTDEAPYIPSITEFCYGERYLNFKAHKIALYPIQHLVLRAFYRGSAGNTSEECMKMTAEEFKLCKEHGLDGEKNGNLMDKWKTGELFTQLVLVWGRRSGKDFTISIIALYEAMRLLECPGGDPYKIYKLGNAAPFNILTIANNKEQAQILFREIHGKMMQSPYFEDKFRPDGITAGKIHLLTPQNRIENRRLEASGLSPNPGSVVIEAGHSNSSGLVGKGCFVLMLDEAGLYKRTGGPGSDEQLYGALSPTVRTYVREEITYDREGNITDVKTHYDGKIISISSPRGMDGVFYNLYSTAEKTQQRLMCRLPTWVVCPAHKEERLRQEESSMTPEKFRMEYGAEFSGTAGGNFFPSEHVELCFKGHGQSMKQWGTPGTTYFAHLDPAFSSHNYALAIVHKQPFVNKELRKLDYFMVLDHLKVWTPEDGKPIQIEEVDQYMIDMHRRFHFGLVSYDQWNSQSSIEKLRRSGIPAICTRFSKNYKIQIYEELRKLVIEERLKLPYNQLLHDEMIHLQRRWMNTGFRIYAKTEGEVRTDDTCDALAGACFNALQKEHNRLPQAKLVSMPLVPAGNQHQWQSSQGYSYSRRDLDTLDRIIRR